MEERLKWWWSYHLSKREIEMMRKNMKKVPLIKQKSEDYHKNQYEEAESFIDKSMTYYDDYITNKEIGENKFIYPYKIWFIKKIIYKIKNLLFKKSHGN